MGIGGGNRVRIFGVCRGAVIEDVSSGKEAGDKLPKPRPDCQSWFVRLKG